MRGNPYREKKTLGFTLMEMVIVLALFATLAAGLLGMLFTVYKVTNSTEYTVSYKTQEDRTRNFIGNVIRQNQTIGAIGIYGADSSTDHLRVKLADNSGQYIHFLIQDKILYTYIGNEIQKLTLTDDEKENNAMPLARDIKSVQFNINADSVTGNRLLNIKLVMERSIYDTGTGMITDKSVEFNYKINIYTR